MLAITKLEAQHILQVLEHCQGRLAAEGVADVDESTIEDAKELLRTLSWYQHEGEEGVDSTEEEEALDGSEG